MPKLPKETKDLLGAFIDDDDIGPEPTKRVHRKKDPEVFGKIPRPTEEETSHCKHGTTTARYAYLASFRMPEKFYRDSEVLRQSKPTICIFEEYKTLFQSIDETARFLVSLGFSQEAAVRRAISHEYPAFLIARPVAW